MDEFIVRSLTREYRIRTDCLDVAKYVTFFAARPDIVGQALAPVELAVERVAEGFLLRLPGGDTRETTAVGAANHLHHLIFSGLQEEAPAAPLIHGASLVWDGRRIILIGPKGSGKSTLTLRLLAGGWDVEGDEHVLVREHDLVARPRRMRVKAGSLVLVTDYAQAIRASPFLPDEAGSPVYAVDPSIGGKPWRIGSGAADLLVFLEANHGGSSNIAALSTEEAFRRLAVDCLLPASQRAVASGRLRKLAASTEAWRLVLGDLREAETCLLGRVAERSQSRAR